MDKDFLKKGTIDEIVYEKCSHLLEGSMIIVSEQNNEVLKKINKIIDNNSSKKIIFGKDFICKKNIKNFIYSDGVGELNLPLPNLHLISCALLQAICFQNFVCNLLCLIFLTAGTAKDQYPCKNSLPYLGIICVSVNFKSIK